MICIENPNSDGYSHKHLDTLERDSSLQVLRDKSNEMEIKMDRETNALKAAVEQSKNEVCIKETHAVLWALP